VKVLIGIDFSLNSPAFCIRRENNFIWGSLTRSDRNENSLKKSKDKPFFILDGMEEFFLSFLERKNIPEEYSEKERIKIVYFMELVDHFWASIAKHCFPGDEVYVAIEGLSFASNGNALIDISMATALLRKKIMDFSGPERFYVFSPTSVKKFALKGNAKKDELYLKIMEMELPETNLHVFTNALKDHRDSWITPKRNINKPIDDIIDATWICLFLGHEIEPKN
jgi:hypothetical protein